MVYPTSLWDGTTLNRDPDLAQNKAPDFRDWNRIVQEVIGIQTKLGVGARTAGTVGTGVADSSQAGQVQQTTLTLTDVAISCAEGGTKEYGSALIYTFPQGAIKVLGITIDLDLASADYASAEEGDLGLGTVAATDQALATTDITWLAASSVVFAGDPGAVTVTDQDDAVAIQDGTTTPCPVYLNVAMDNGGGAGDITVSGTVKITWVNLGDY